MNNNIKLEDIKAESLTTEQKEFLVSGLFSMISNEDNQFVSKEKYNELENRINKAIELIEEKLKTLYHIVDRQPYENLLRILKGESNDK